MLAREAERKAPKSNAERNQSPRSTKTKRMSYSHPKASGEERKRSFCLQNPKKTTINN
jgi:hypothetical protein